MHKEKVISKGLTQANPKRPRNYVVKLDMTGKKAMSLSQEKYDSIFNNAPIGIVYFDLDGTVLECNKYLAKILGAPVNKIVGVNMPGAFKNEAQKAALAQALKGKTGIFEGVYTSVTGGKTAVLRTIYTPVFNSRGVMAGGMGITEDVTASKHTAETLKERETFLESIIEQSPNPLWVSDARGKIIKINAALKDLLKISDIEIVGKYNVLEDVQVIEQGFLPLVESVFKKGKTVSFNIDYHTQKETRLKLSQSVHRLLEIVIAPVKDAGGKVVNAVCLQKDVTEQKQTEAALRESEAKLKSLVESSNDQIFMIDRDYKYLVINTVLAKLIGKQPGEIIGKSLFEIFPEDISNQFSQKVDLAFASDKGLYIEEHASVFDTSLFLSTNITPVQDETGKIIAVSGITRDITHLKHIEDSLRDNEARYRSLFEDSMDAIVLTTMEGSFLDVNHAACQTLGYTKEELLSVTVSRIYKDPSDRTRYLDEIKAKGFVKEYELQLRRKDGSIIDTITAANIWFLPDGKIGGIREIIRDVTEQKQMDAERARYDSELLNSMRAAVEAIASMTEKRDPYTSGHQKRVAQLAAAIARELGLSENRIECIRLASTIHDIGKITVPAEILSKPGHLSDVEFNLIKTHPEAAAEIIRPIRFPWNIADVVVKHHERLDGSGYPGRLKADQICLESRIIAVADVVEAMSSHRPYRAALGVDLALKEIENNKGTLFDSSAVDACVKLFNNKGFNFEE